MTFHRPALRPPPYVPGPPPQDVLYGCGASVALVDSTRLRELQDMVAVGCNTVRIDASQSNNDIAETLFQRWMIIYNASLGGMSTTIANPAPVATLVNRYGQDRIILEPINEPNFMATTAANFAVLQRNWYRAVKGVLPNVTIALSSIGNGSSSTEGKTPMQWAQTLIDNGCIFGDGYDYPNYHAYGDQVFFHFWTPDGAGNSVNKIMGNHQFYLTEFGQSLSGVSGNENTQATNIGNRLAEAQAEPKCIGIWQYAMSDDAPGVGTGYGLRRHDLSHRPAWTTYQNGIT